MEQAILKTGLGDKLNEPHMLEKIEIRSLRIKDDNSSTHGSLTTKSNGTSFRAIQKDAQGDQNENKELLIATDGEDK